MSRMMMNTFTIWSDVLLIWLENLLPIPSRNKSFQLKDFRPKQTETKRQKNPPALSNLTKQLFSDLAAGFRLMMMMIETVLLSSPHLHLFPLHLLSLLLYPFHLSVGIGINQNKNERSTEDSTLAEQDKKNKPATKWRSELNQHNSSTPPRLISFNCP